MFFELLMKLHMKLPIGFHIQTKESQRGQHEQTCLQMHPSTKRNRGMQVSHSSGAGIQPWGQPWELTGKHFYSLSWLYFPTSLGWPGIHPARSGEVPGGSQKKYKCDLLYIFIHFVIFTIVINLEIELLLDWSLWISRGITRAYWLAWRPTWRSTWRSTSGRCEALQSHRVVLWHGAPLNGRLQLQ